jgi:hypothetical protein
MSELLFNDYSLGDFLRAELERAKRTVDSISEDQFMHSPDDEVFEHVFSQLQIEPIKLHEDQMEMDKKEVKVRVSAGIDRLHGGHVPGLRISISVPYIGNPHLWRCHPSTWSQMKPRAQISTSGHGAFDGYVNLVIERPTDTLKDGHELKSSIKRELENIDKYLGFVKNDIEKHNQDLERTIRAAIEARRHRIEKHGEVIKTLNIPLKRDERAPDISKLPVRKKVIKPLPASPKTPPEPGIDSDVYEEILRIIRHQGRTFERTPSTYAVHGEEELRDIILSNLNTFFEGLATGEAFRKSGKTDITIEDKNRAAFVAECKIWKGEKALNDAIDQLLGYLVWRDCKTALIIFNKDVAGFSKIQEKLPEVLSAHRSFIKQFTINEYGEWRFIFSSEDDEDRHITMHIFLFNLYVKE